MEQNSEVSRKAGTKDGSNTAKYKIVLAANYFITILSGVPSGSLTAVVE